MKIYLLLFAFVLVACGAPKKDNQTELISTLQHQQDSLITALNSQKEQQKKDTEKNTIASRRSKFIGQSYAEVRNQLLLKFSLEDMDEGVFDDTKEKYIIVNSGFSEQWFKFRNNKCSSLTFREPVKNASLYIADFNNKGFVRDERKNNWADTIAKCIWTIENYGNGKIQVDCKTSN